MTLDEIDDARSSDVAADALAARVGAAPVSPPRTQRIAAVTLGALFVLPGLLIGLAPAARGSWGALAMSALLVVAGAGVTASRPWGPSLAVLAAVSLLLRALAGAIETGAGWPLVALSLALGSAAGWLAVARARRLRAVLAASATDAPLRELRIERARHGPSLVRALAALVATYVVFTAAALVYHRLRGIDAPFGIVVRGTDLAALAMRMAFYGLTIGAALFAAKGHGRPVGTQRDLARSAVRGVLLFLGTFAILSSVGSVLDLVAALRGSRVGALATSLRAGLEAETARPERGFDPIRIAYVAVLAPLGEELLFRWALFRALRTRMPFALAALVQAAVFALLHRYRFAAYQTLFIGIASAWAVERTRRIAPSIVAHGLWNGLQSLG